ncbi:MAG: RNA methyltransferase [Rhizobiaceae bacterium]|nr:RNA methyltransferase [Rhizobiaceae bacterium]
MIAVEIEDAGDPRIAAYRNVRDRDLARRDDLFIAEGKVVLRQLFESGRFEPVSVLVLENRLPGLVDVLTTAPEGLPVYVAKPEVIDAIAGFHLHRGVLALARRREPETVSGLIAALPAKALVLALVGISNHDNMGGIFRNAAAFGADAVILDPTCCDPLYRKAIRVSVGGVLKVPYAVATDWSSMADDLAAAGFRQFALTPGGTLGIADVEPGKRAALYLGTEGDGLPPELIDRMEGVRIPIAGDFDSLNVAAASAIALHRLSGNVV